MLLIAVLLFFGFYPQPMIDTVDQGVRPLLHRINPDAIPKTASAGHGGKEHDAHGGKDHGGKDHGDEGHD